MTARPVMRIHLRPLLHRPARRCRCAAPSADRRAGDTPPSPPIRPRPPPRAGGKLERLGEPRQRLAGPALPLRGSRRQRVGAARADERRRPGPRLGVDRLAGRGGHGLPGTAQALHDRRSVDGRRAPCRSPTRVATSGRCRSAVRERPAGACSPGAPEVQTSRWPRASPRSRACEPLARLAGEVRLRKAGAPAEPAAPGATESAVAPASAGVAAAAPAAAPQKTGAGGHLKNLGLVLGANVVGLAALYGINQLGKGRAARAPSPARRACASSAPRTRRASATTRSSSAPPAARRQTGLAEGETGCDGGLRPCAANLSCNLLLAASARAKTDAAPSEPVTRRGRAVSARRAGGGRPTRPGPAGLTV